MTPPFCPPSQASYNSVLVEQYLLLNRREPDAYAEVVEEDPDDPSIRVYICSTMYREAAYEMKQLIKSVLKVDGSVRNVFEWHVFLDGGCSGNQLGQHAIQVRRGEGGGWGACTTCP